MSPFLTARGRLVLSKAIEPHLDSIHYVATDGFVCDKKLPLKLSTELGGWRLDNEGEVYIKHCKKKLFGEKA